MRKDHLQELGGYDENFRYAQDYELMTRWLDAGYSVKYLRDCLYQTRQPSASISQSKREEQVEFGKQIRRRWREKLFCK
jgi:hypothetical protein